MKAQKYFNSSWGLCIFCILLSNSLFAGIDGKKLTIGDSTKQGGAPYFYATLDAAGFSDWIYYGYSPIHDYPYHELLSGEWGAAIYYEGIDTAVIDPNTGQRQAMWLTQQFEYPYWSTHSTFSAPGLCAAWNNPANPAPGMNTGQSVITNGDVEITIDYEVVDLEPLAGDFYSPMSFIADPNGGAIGYMYSDRYVFLQTYTLRNLKDQALTDLEFYQFLHGHGADEYGPAVHSTYCDVLLQDPLADYTPYNPVHQVGNFRYDITQWNGPMSSQSHTDYVGFSSPLAPDWFDNDTYNGHNGRPQDGTHVHIENRNLNGIDRIYNAEVGGAMGWSLGSLDPNETISLTVVFLFGPQQETPDLILTKTDDVEPPSCVEPGAPLTYTIRWQNIGMADAENAVLKDYLPAGVDYNYVLGLSPLVLDPNYNAAEHSYTWQIGTIPASGSGSRQLSVTVNEKAEPGMLMKNKAVLTTSIGQVSTQMGTPVCCWDGDIIYVDRQATGANIGTDWRNAYTNLQSALARAAAGCGAEIWVARETYDPGRSAEATFAIPDGVSVYGGFLGTEASRDQRHPDRYKTILTGAAETERNGTVVTMGDGTILDGFTVTGAVDYGVYGSGVDFSLENCVVENNEQYGVYAINGDVSIKWCKIKNNTLDGIYHSGQRSIIILDNCQILENLEYGIYSENSTPTIKTVSYTHLTLPTKRIV